MKRKIFSVVGTIWKIFIPIISAIIGLLIANKIDIFAQFKLPESISSYDICIAVYFPVVDIIITSVTDLIKSALFSQSIEVIMWLPGNNPEIKAEPSIILREERPSEIKLTISVIGSKCLCGSSKVIIEPPNFVTFGLPRSNPAMHIDENGKVVLSVDKLFGGQKKVNTQQEFRILLTKEQVEGTSSSVIDPIFEGNILIATTSNKVTVSTEG